MTRSFPFLNAYSTLSKKSSKRTVVGPNKTRQEHGSYDIQTGFRKREK